MQMNNSLLCAVAGCWAKFCYHKTKKKHSSARWWVDFSFSVVCEVGGGVDYICMLLGKLSSRFPSHA